MIAAQVIRSIVDLPAIYEYRVSDSQKEQRATHIRSSQQNHLFRLSSQIDVVGNEICRRTISRLVSSALYREMSMRKSDLKTQGCRSSSNSTIAESDSIISGRTQGSPNAAELLESERRQSSSATILITCIHVE